MVFLRILTLTLLANWLIYWKIEQRKAYKHIPPKTVHSWYKRLSEGLIKILFVFVFFQLITGITFFSMGNSIIVQLIGVGIVTLGVVICVFARIVLANNWSNAYEYQIKKNQGLVTAGIYKYIRHPIYTGITLFFVGSELVVGSWLWISFLFLFVGAYVQGRREENILVAHFGKKYEEYMKRSKMLIPFIF